MDDELETTSSDTNNDAPLTLSEAVKAFAATETEDEADTGQSDADEAQQGNADEEQPPDEGGEDEEGNAADEEQAEGDDETEEEAPESDRGRFVSDTGKVRMEDGSIVSIADLKKGTLLHADYTRKTQEVAEQRRTVETQSQRYQQQEQQLTEQQQYIAELVQSIIPPPPSPSLADPRSPDYDPARYQAEDVAHRQWQQHLQYLDQQKQQATQARQAEATEADKGKLTTEWQATLQKLPKLADPKRLEAFGKDTVKYGMKWGFSAQELQRLPYDHRQLVILDKAIAYDKLQAKQAAQNAKPDPKNEVQRPPVLKGGKRMNPAQAKARDANAAMERLNKTGSLRDGVAAFLATQKG